MIKKLFLAACVLLTLATPADAFWSRPMEKIVVIVPNAHGDPLVAYFTNSNDVVLHEGHVTVTPRDGMGHALPTLELYGQVLVIHEAQYEGEPRIVVPQNPEDM